MSLRRPLAKLAPYSLRTRLVATVEPVEKWPKIWRIRMSRRLRQRYGLSNARQGSRYRARTGGFEPIGRRRRLEFVRLKSPLASGALTKTYAFPDGAAATKRGFPAIFRRNLSYAVSFIT